MGIQDRDYMRRPRNESGGGSGSNDDPRSSWREPDDGNGIAGRFLRKYPKLPLYLGLAFVALILVAVIVTKFSSSGH